MGSIGDFESTMRANEPSIIDIRSDKGSLELEQDIRNGLSAEEGQRTLPTLLLYDDDGLKLYEDITYLEEYYLFQAEIGILEKHADDIAIAIPENAMIVELGSGNLRKIKILLDALERAQKHVAYYALDLMQSELQRTLVEIPSYDYVQCFGLWGTYNDGLAFLKEPSNNTKPKAIMSLGSSIGNFNRDEASDFLAQFVSVLGPRDALIIAVDGCQDAQKVHLAYNDPKGVTDKFTLNGLSHANDLLGYTAFVVGDWEAIGEYDGVAGRHKAYVSPKQDCTIEGVRLRKGERVHIETSYKYDETQATKLWRNAGLVEDAKWTNDEGFYGLHLLKKANMALPIDPMVYAADPVPSLEDWRQLWAVWDTVTRQMVPEEQLLDKPIKLRNACIFYLGHIPTFFDIKLTEATGTKLTEPKYFTKIFERGIDPDVDNPEHCHAHSEIPDSWPPLDVILMYQEAVRQRVRDLYKSGEAHSDSWTGRAIWLGFEHEIMHLETLLYMLLQSDWTQPPATAPTPDFKSLAVEASEAAIDNEWITVPKQTITIGLTDADSAEGPVRHFGWDVEKPQRSVSVKALQAKARPITVGEYAHYMVETGQSSIPASWSTINLESERSEANGLTNGEAKYHTFIRDKAVRTMYGPVPLHLTLDWPVAASYDEIAGCVAYMGGRIPTLEETRSIYYYADILKREKASNVQKTIPAVNGHLVNDGVEESPPAHRSVDDVASTSAGLDPKELFVGLDRANVGFKHWHPMPVTQNGSTLAGQGEIGGLWEWTSTSLTKQDGFEPMKLYPAYSDDFYDGKHNVVLGGSWATHPRVAGRKTFVNWYQRNYPYAWTGGRLVKDD